MTSAVDKAREALTESLGFAEDQVTRVKNAITALDGKPAAKPRRSPGRPPGSKAAAPKRRRRKGGKTRADEAVKLIEKKPGISASDIAKAMKIKPNYLYRVLGDLEKEGRVKKQGRQYFPAG
jgi:DNA invertase Pin-like site-specific DNA recombinase